MSKPVAGMRKPVGLIPANYGSPTIRPSGNLSNITWRADGGLAFARWTSHAGPQDLYNPAALASCGYLGAYMECWPYCISANIAQNPPFGSS